MALIWDYDINELKKLERQINFGIDWENGEKINLAQVVKYWTELKIDKYSRQLFELLISKENLPILKIKISFRRRRRTEKIWPLIFSS